MSLYCGVDFGTSNSVLTLVDDDGASVFSRREPTLMYFRDDPNTTARRYCGAEALEKYVEEGMTGRFFQSIKTVLPDPTFTQTMINGKRFTAEDLVAVMLRFLRHAAQDDHGTRIDHAVIGRPARFSEDDTREELAQTRLEKAAGQAGFASVLFEFEPVAGARSYLARITRESIVLVADHGGGTSDFTIMRMLPNHPDGARTGDVLATHGIRAGGDDFDAEIMWNRIVSAFGYGSTFESFGKQLPVPVHIFKIISRWDQIHFLKTTAYREELRSYLRSTDNPLAIRRLIKLVEENLGLFVSRAVERAKIDLSERDVATVRYDRDRLHILEEITRSEFDHYIVRWMTAIGHAVDETLARAGIGPESIDAVFMTGGSASVPAVRNVLAARFGDHHLVTDGRQFESVAEGLALSARNHGLAVL